MNRTRSGSTARAQPRPDQIPMLCVLTGLVLIVYLIESHRNLFGFIPVKCLRHSLINNSNVSVKNRVYELCVEQLTFAVAVNFQRICWHIAYILEWTLKKKNSIVNFVNSESISGVPKCRWPCAICHRRRLQLSHRRPGNGWTNVQTSKISQSTTTTRMVNCLGGHMSVLCTIGNLGQRKSRRLLTHN